MSEVGRKEERPDRESPAIARLHAGRETWVVRGTCSVRGIQVHDRAIRPGVRVSATDPECKRWRGLPLPLELDSVAEHIALVFNEVIPALWQVLASLDVFPPQFEHSRVQRQTPVEQAGFLAKRIAPEVVGPESQWCAGYGSKIGRTGRRAAEGHGLNESAVT